MAVISHHVLIVELKSKFPPWYDGCVRDLLRENEKSFRRNRAVPSENKARFSAARADFKSQATVKYREYLFGSFVSFKDNPKRYWSFVKSAKSSAQVSPVLECDGRI